MRLSCLPVSFFADITEGRMQVRDWARIGADLGLDGIDLSILFVSDRSPAGVAALRREIEAEGIRVAMVTSYPDFTHPVADQREPRVDTGAGGGSCGSWPGCRDGACYSRPGSPHDGR